MQYLKDKGDNINIIFYKFMDEIQGKVNEIFPIKSVRVPINQKPWFNHKLRELSEKKKKLFEKSLVKQFYLSKQISVKQYIDKTTNDINDLHKANIHIKSP